MFDKMRELGKDSIYHCQYQIYKAGKLFGRLLYNKRISAEELYTFANNIHWELKSVKNPFVFSKDQMDKNIIKVSFGASL